MMCNLNNKVDNRLCIVLSPVSSVRLQQWRLAVRRVSSWWSGRRSRFVSCASMTVR